MHAEKLIEIEDLPEAPLASATDEDLLKRARAGDRAAFGMLYERHAPRMRATLVPYARQPADVDDLVQETFARALAAISRFRGDSQFSTWLHRIAVNCAINTNTRRSSEYTNAEMNEPYTDIGPEQLVLSASRTRQTSAALSELPVVMRQALVLNSVRGLDYEAVSQVASCPVGTVRSRISRARSLLAEAVDG